MYSTSQDVTLAGKWRCLGGWRGLYILKHLVHFFCLIILNNSFWARIPRPRSETSFCLFKDRLLSFGKIPWFKRNVTSLPWFKAKNEESSEQKESGALRANLNFWLAIFSLLCRYALLGYDKKYIQANRLEFSLNFCSEDWKGYNLI